MKCKMTEKKNMQIMLAVGLAMVAVGALMGFLLPEEAHGLTKAAGLISGAGSAFAIMSAVVLLCRMRLGEARAADSELAMTDERGMAVAYKAQNVAAIVAILCIVVIMLTALFRGDMLYMKMGVITCFAVAIAKFVALRVYNKLM